jgi:diguanylate cyclase (GGDEF)-like protein/PAS domain S-box-containing protein
MPNLAKLKTETARLQSLYELDIISSRANEIFQKITEQAAELGDTDYACIKLLDKNQSWVFTGTRTGADEIPREFSLCAATIEHGEDMLKLNLNHDTRFEHNPLLQAHPDLRFYVGMPLYSRGGHALGCLSIMAATDKPLHLKQQENRLLDLAYEASRQIEFFYNSARRADTQSILSYLAIASAATLVTEEDGTILLVNSAAECLFGTSRKKLLGASLESLFPKDFRRLYAVQREKCQKNPYPSKMLENKPAEVEFKNFRGEHLHVTVNLTPLQASEENLIVISLHDVTEHIITRKSLSKLSTGIAANSSHGLFESLGELLVKETGATYITIGKLDIDKNAVQTLAFLDQDTLHQNFSYELKGTPCDTTIEEHSCVVTHDLQAAYPNDVLIGKMNLQAYLGVRLYASNGEVYGLINALFDYPITHRQAALTLDLLKVAALRAAPELERLGNEETLKKLSTSVEHSPNAVVITDSNSIIEYINSSYTKMTGFSQYDCIGQEVTLNSSGKTPPEVYLKMWKEIKAGRVWEGDLENKRKDGTLYWARTKIFSIRNSNEEIIHLVGIQEDISHHKHLREKLQYEATHDQLTGLYNRREFERRLDAALSSAREQGKIHALCFLDLDHFKVLNDTSGHVAGDILLGKVSEILKKRIRTHDVSARLGGDEFALLLQDCSVEQAGKVAENIREAICGINFIWESRANSVGVSIGITEITGAIADPTEVMKRVDAACYMAKKKGRNRIGFYREDSEAIHHHRQEIDWVPRIRTALSEDRFELYVQAVMHLDHSSYNRACYHEVLLRLKEGDTLVSPGVFLPAVERYHLSGVMDRYVINKAFKWIEDNPQAMKRLCGLGLNLSGASLTDSSLQEFIITKLEDGSVPASKVKFEITETAAITDIVEVSQFMKRIRAVGSQVVLDDFGSGLSSFPYLRSLPVDILKIDGKMVREIAHDEASRIMVKMINEMAHSLGYRTVAEYVEDESILACLLELKVDCVQGFGVAIPTPLSDMGGAGSPDSDIST